MFICSHLEPLDRFIRANKIWIVLGQTVKGAVSYDSTEELGEAEGRFSRAMSRCSFKLWRESVGCGAELSPLPVLAQAEITQLRFFPLSMPVSKTLLLQRVYLQNALCRNSIRL